jgi:hypothetical protein
MKKFNASCSLEIFTTTTKAALLKAREPLKSQQPCNLHVDYLSLRLTHKERTAKISPPCNLHTQIEGEKYGKIRKPKSYAPKRVFLETLIGYVEAAKCRTLDNFTEVKTQ